MFAFLLLWALAISVQAQPPFKAIVYRDATGKLRNQRFSKQTITTTDFTVSNRYWHYYKMDLKAGDIVYVKCSSMSFAVGFQLLDINANPLGQKIDTADFSIISSLEAALPIKDDGTYVLGVSSAQESKTGNYDLTIAIAPPASIHFTGSTLCDKLNFLTAHKALNYIFIIGDQIKDKDTGSIAMSRTDYIAPLKVFENIPAKFEARRTFGGPVYLQDSIYSSKNLKDITGKLNKYAGQIKECLTSGFTFKTETDTSTHLPVFRAYTSDGMAALSLLIVKSDVGVYWMKMEY